MKTNIERVCRVSLPAYVSYRQFSRVQALVALIHLEFGGIDSVHVFREHSSKEAIVSYSNEAVSAEYRVPLFPSSVIGPLLSTAAFLAVHGSIFQPSKFWDYLHAKSHC